MGKTNCLEWKARPRAPTLIRLIPKRFERSEAIERLERFEPPEIKLKDVDRITR
jgi:hypothetical protein